MSEMLDYPLMPEADKEDIRQLLIDAGVDVRDIEEIGTSALITTLFRVCISQQTKIKALCYDMTQKATRDDLYRAYYYREFLGD